MNKKIVIEMKYDELEDMVKETWGHDWEFVSDQECSNDSSHEFSVDGEIDEWGQKEIDEFAKTGKGSFLARDLMNTLYKMGKLEKGEYLIQVCW